MPRGETWGRWSSGAYTRGGAGREKRGPPTQRAARKSFSLAPKDLPVGEKTKTVGNWADMPGAVPTVRGDAGARRCPPRLRARGGGVRVGFGARRALVTHLVAGGTDEPQLSSETFFSLSQGMWEARFQPGWIWFLRICANRKRGRTPDESCLSKLHCGSGSVGFV